MKILQLTFIILLILFTNCEVPDTAGYDIGEIKGYKQLGKSGASTLYEVDCPQIQDGRPFKLL